jgi:YbbR domain-containing protein
LFDDLLLKVVSLGLAIVLWATVSTLIEKNAQREGVAMESNKQFVGVPISVALPEGDATGFKVIPSRATVFIQGTPEAIDNLQASSVHAWVDLSYWDARENLPLPVSVSSPAGTAWVSVSPAEVRVVPPEAEPVGETATGTSSQP